MSRRCAVILAGGDGVRLRSMTRGITGDDRPKQFCALVGSDTLLTETRRRAALVAPTHRTLVVVNRAHERFYTPLLADLRARTLAAQPENRGTAVAIVYALLGLAGRQAAGDTVAFLPSDHFVSDDAVFLHRSFAEMSDALGRVGEFAALERLYCSLPSVDFSRQVLSARPDRLAVLPVQGVHWSDLGDPERVLATRRRTRVMSMRAPILEPISA